MKIENERVRGMLVKWGRAEMRICELKDELKWARTEADDLRDTLSAQSLTGMPGSRKRKDVSDLMVRIEKADRAFADLARRIDDEIAETLTMKSWMDGLIVQLPEKHQEILRMWYRRGMSHVQIARVTHYSVDRAKHIKTEAEDMLARKIESGAKVSTL